MTALAEIGRPRSRARRMAVDRLFRWACRAALWGGVAALAVALGWLVRDGAPVLGLDFLGSGPSGTPERAGIGPALVGTVWVSGVAACVAVPLAVATALLLEELEPSHPWLRRLQDFVRVNLAGLAGVSPMVYGILGVVVFVQFGGLRGDLAPLPVLEGTPLHFELPFGRSVLAGGSTLALVMLPSLTLGVQRALRSVPVSLREDTLALGASPMQMMLRVTVPVAVPRIVAEVVLAFGRSIGEAAPLLAVAGLAYVSSPPSSLADEFTVLPLQIFDWARRPEPAFRQLAAAATVVLIGVQLLLFAAAARLSRRAHPLGGRR